MPHQLAILKMVMHVSDYPLQQLDYRNWQMIGEGDTNINFA